MDDDDVAKARESMGRPKYPPGGQRYGPPMIPPTPAEARALFNEGYTIEQIAEAFECNRSTVRRRLGPGH